MERSIAEGGVKSAHFRNLSEVYRLQARLDEALAAARRAVALDPADPLGPFNLAMVHYDRLETEACIAAARHSLDLRPNLPQSHMKLAQAHLLRGEFEPGWAEYEWRYQIPGAQPLMPKTDKPQWDGRELPEGCVLLVADQGFGDVVMFSAISPGCASASATWRWRAARKCCRRWRACIRACRCSTAGISARLMLRTVRSPAAAVARHAAR